MNCIFCGGRADEIMIGSGRVLGWKCRDWRGCSGRGRDRHGPERMLGRLYRSFGQQRMYEAKVPPGVLFVATSEEI